jgi:predicted Zn-dependent protease with MMP-like domain
MNWPRLQELACAEVARTLAELPPDLRSRASALPISYERVPSPDVLEDGEEPDTLLGLFVGGEFAEEEHVPLPAQIILYLENIWAMAEGNEESFREEVRVTLIHELGHYLGLNEDELDERGLL